MLYIADSFNKNIRQLALDQPGSVGSVVASLIDRPSSIYIDDDNDGPTIYVSLEYIHCWVEKWIYGSSSGIQVGDKVSYCTGISVDKEKNLYMVEPFENRVLKLSSKTNTTTIIASPDDEFQTTNQRLSRPQDLHINPIDNSLYVVDQNNHRIQKWSNDGKIRITVAGSSIGENGNDAALLYFPNGIFVDDETETIYVADTHSYRVQRWLVNASEGETIAGGDGDDDSAQQYLFPADLDFDDEGNLYVSDASKSRIQKFEIIDNRPCSTISKRTTPLITTTHVLTTITSPTTALNNHAVCSYWNCYYALTRTMATELIIFWIIAILF